MNHETIIPVLAVAILVIGIGILSAAEETNFSIVSVSTNSDTYKSYDDMVIHVIVKSGASMNAVLAVDGIRDPSGNYRLSQRNDVVMNNGNNEFDITYKLPTCSRCAGLPPGVYDINVSVSSQSYEVFQTVKVNLS